MRISDLRNDVSEALRSFAWEQWAQLGVLASTDRQDPWAADPEALLLFTLEVGRDEPRLYDEVLDWLVVNERLISVQRLRNLCRDDEDRALAAASLAWVARWRPRARLASNEVASTGVGQSLFRRERTPRAPVDPDFSRHGLLKPLAEPSGKSRAPDPHRPIAFAFRMRHLLGIGARAEVMRVLLCTEAPSVTVQVVAESVGFAKRNVQEALVSLAAAGVVDVATVGNEHRFRAPRERWAGLLGAGVDSLPRHRDWPQLLDALRHLLRWLWRADLGDLTEYMLASEARTLAGEIVPDLRYAGVRVSEEGGPGAAYWADFVELAKTAARAPADPTA